MDVLVSISRGFCQPQHSEGSRRKEKEERREKRSHRDSPSAWPLTVSVSLSSRAIQGYPCFCKPARDKVPLVAIKCRDPRPRLLCNSDLQGLQGSNKFLCVQLF